MAGRDQYDCTKGPYYIVKPCTIPPVEHNEVESSKKLRKLGKFLKLRAVTLIKTEY